MPANKTKQYVMKKQPKYINVSKNPIIIIGEKMGKQRAGQDTYALEGNRTGDFVHEAIGDKQNIILTNIINYYYEGNFDRKDPGIIEGMSDLAFMIYKEKPSKLITLGNIAYFYTLKVLSVIKTGTPLFNMPHPSWINRFQSSNRHNYIKILSDELNK